MKYLLTVLCIFIVTVISQAQITYTYSFDNCSFASSTGGADAVSETLPSCECGIKNDGVYFDGSISSMTIPMDVDSVFSQDFTLDFYFRVERATGNTDIISIRNSCALDSLIAIKYIPENKSLAVEMARNTENYKLYNFPLDENKCWNRFTLSKTGLSYKIYVNNELKDEYLPPANIVFGDNAKFAVSNSPCLATFDKRFRGWIDELSIIPRGLSQTEIIRSYLYPDEIRTQDTTIVQGEMLDLSIGTTCSKNIVWTPSSSIISDQDTTIRVRPDTSTTYTATFTHTPRCITSDKVRIYVVSENQRDCSKILLPKAFTPNGDRVNDTYGVDNLFLVSELKSFEIYDKNGAIMWRARTKSDRWDGTFDGSHINSGMYLYRISYVCDGKEYTKVDNFALLR